ncbi:hypothetical protein BJV78DRAFT_1156577 [Lactifluus subvellereus]|nr:hypothetical protein BJV78DRAFT_1156577 [Lactifluus subvellereus]
MIDDMTGSDIIRTLASSQRVEGNIEEQSSTPRNDPTITDAWRLNVNIRLGVALNFVEGANTARMVMHTVVVVLLALAAGCTGFLTSVAALLLTWLVPSVRRSPPEVMEKLHRRTHPAQPRVPPRLAGGELKKTDSFPTPGPVHHVSFDEPVLKPEGPSSAPATAPSSPRGRSIPLPRCKSRTSPPAAVSLPQASSRIMAVDSPLSSAETLAEAPPPPELKRAFSSRLTRVLYSRGRQRARASTVASASSTSTTAASEFGERAVITGEGETRPKVTERGRFGFLKKAKAGRSRPPPLLLSSSPVSSAADSFPSSPDPTPLPSSTTSLPLHRRVLSTPTASSKLRIADKICSRKEKDKGAEPKPRPARTQPYGPPYNWTPPAPGAWAVANGADEPMTSERQRKQLSMPIGPTSPPTRHGRERIASMPVPRTAV